MQNQSRRSTPGSRSASLGARGEAAERPGRPPPVLPSEPHPTPPPCLSPQVCTGMALPLKGLGPRRPGPYGRACRGASRQTDSRARAQSRAEEMASGLLAPDSSAPGHFASSLELWAETHAGKQRFTPPCRAGTAWQSWLRGRGHVTRGRTGRPSEWRANYTAVRISSPVIKGVTSSGPGHSLGRSLGDRTLAERARGPLEDRPPWLPAPGLALPSEPRGPGALSRDQEPVCWEMGCAGYAVRRPSRLSTPDTPRSPQKGCLIAS